jgi:hypothetical protein
MGLMRAEQETVIRWDRDSDEVSVWSADPVTWRRMARLGVAPRRETTTGGIGRVATSDLARAEGTDSNWFLSAPQ